MVFVEKPFNLSGSAKDWMAWIKPQKDIVTNKLNRPRDQETKRPRDQE